MDPYSTELLLRDYAPRTVLRLPDTTPERPKFPVIDAHNHLGTAFGPFSGDWPTRPVSELVETRREGLWVRYRLGELNDPVLAAIVNAVGHALTHADTVRGDANRLQKRTGCCVPEPGDLARVSCCSLEPVGATGR